MQTEVQKIGERSLARAKELLLRGECVAFPTETVYGLGADARSDEAVERIYRVKGRPQDNPLIVHIHRGSTSALSSTTSRTRKNCARRSCRGR